MNCEKFETIIIDLARGGVMDVAMREDASAHAESCRPCAARLANECALTEALRAFAAASENIEAPLQVETNLRAAFRKHAVIASTTSLSSPVLAARSSVLNIKSPRRRIVWTAIAAMLLICFSLTAATRFFYTPPDTETATTNAVSSSTNLSGMNAPVKQASNASSQTIDASPNITPVEVIKAKQQTSFGHTSNGLQPVAIANVANTNAARRRSNYKGSLNHNDSRADFKDDVMAAVNRDEIATDFLPLVDAGNLAGQDGGQLVRVKLPRSALLAFGLPMNIERADEPVKADVVVGEDGLARAIRFVR